MAELISAQDSSGYRARARRRATVVAASLASLLVAGSAVAASWSAPVALSSGDVFFGNDLVTLSSTRAVSVFTESGTPDQLFVSRTTNGGGSWTAAAPLGAGSSPQLAGHGMNVDLVFNQSNGRVRYARSTDGGVTFGPSVALSPAGRYAWWPNVGRGADGTVAVIYEDVVNGNVYVRVSHDGGLSFDPADLLTQNGDESGLDAAVGDGVIYAAYTTEGSRVRVRRSTDGGATWRAAAKITNQHLYGSVSLVAAGTHAYVAFTDPNDFENFGEVKYRRTTNSGASWSGKINLAPHEWSTGEPDLGLHGGVLRAVFVRCTPEWDICESDRSYYRQSNTGTTWGAPQRITPNDLWYGWSANVGAHKAIVTYLGEDETGDFLYARTRMP